MKNNVELNVQLTSNLKNIQKQLPEEIEKRMLQSAVELHGKTVRILSGSRSGRLYKVPAVNRMHRASAVGEPPAQLLGALRTGYKFTVYGKGYESMGVVGSPEPYAYWLEYGTKKMKPRQHLRRAYRENYEQIIRFFEGLL